MHTKTAHELHELLVNKKISSVELTTALYDRIAGTDDKIKGYVTLTRDEALKQAQAADERLTTGANPTPLTGIPIAIKDNFCTRGIKTTCSSKMLENYLPPYDATVVTKLKEAGAVILGKTNMDEFAMGSSCENSAFFPTRNPWNRECVPGGSSGGSAAVVAARSAVMATGSDTGGSIRQPAAFCGVVGLKPTYGRVSRYGLVAFASSLDQIGPLTKDVTDTALMLNVIAGHDDRDATSIEHPVPDYRSALKNDVKKVRVGLIRELLGSGIEPTVKAAVKGAADQLAALGAEIVEVSLPSFEHAIATYYLIAPAEASSNLARYDGVKFGHRSQEHRDLISMYYNTRREGFGAEVKRRIMLGTYALSAGYYDAFYLKALKVRTLIKRDFDQAFERCDLLASPTTPTVAFKLGAKSADPVAMYLSDIATIPVNLAGLPALSLPCGNSSGLPIGLQLIGPAFAEELILRVAYTYEQNTAWHQTSAVI
ncbi:MAG: Asp-tRNA(Asn)/Glu-tRNA(Gln) amidotransferase subunit GatA [Candidatus Margulisbacteria bacterium]|jgi:aspartyl-tRNA(Asn)/glutamyl-tRNA(Gln) amidotransferase subunit A|nr:Asp-tRNA(Asn)/Glu-tRNA(Gln) amidotransferase subunit GatA [Candidatus Margulisiibacteriota bacterium]